MSTFSYVDDDHSWSEKLHSITYSYIKQLNPGESTRPEVSSPIQPVGDIAEIPHFPNRAFSETRSSDILRKKREVEADMSQIRVITAANLFLDFVNNFDRINMYNAESVILVCDAYDLEDEKSSIEKDKYKERRNSIFLRMMSIMNDIIKQSPDEVNHSNI